MLHSLSGTVRKLLPPQVEIDVAGVGYLASVPHPLWESLEEGSTQRIVVYAYIREDRFDLYGFGSDAERTFFGELISLNGIGPKIALELCSMPRSVLHAAVLHDDARTLTQVKGVGARTAEKLLLELKAIVEKHPDQWQGEAAMPGQSSAFDPDVLAALLSLGYDERTVRDELKKLPKDVKNTEERVRAILRSLSSSAQANRASRKLSRSRPSRV